MESTTKMSEKEDFEFRLRLEKEQQAQPPTQPQPTLGTNVLGGAISGFKLAGLPGALGGAVRPIGTAVDKAITEGAYEAGGRTAELASKAGLPSEVAGGLGVAANVGLQAFPAMVGGKGIGKSVEPVLENTSKFLMKSAVKPPLEAWKSGKAAEAIQTMLDEGITVSAGGVAKLKGKISALNDEIGKTIMNSTATVDKNNVYRTIKETLDKFTNQVNPNTDIARIRAAWNEFINHPSIVGDTMPVQLAQKLKQGTYQQVSKKYGELSSAETEAQKSLARGLKEEIATAVPEVSGLNAEESKLINALNLSEKQAFLSMNKNPGSLAWLAHRPETWAAFMADKSALFKSLMARVLYSGAERIPEAAAGTGIATVQASKQEQP